YEGKAIGIQVSAGMSTLLGEDDTGEAAVSRALIAMRAAKRRREGLVVAEESADSDAALADAGGLEAGATLGGMYQILHEISRGAMGVVYRAEDLGLSRIVAIKTLRPDLAGDKALVRRFRSEAATLAALHHEHLVQVHAFGVDGETVYFVMELVEGESLEDRAYSAGIDGRYVHL